MSTLFINACVREHSRTMILADHLLRRIGGDITTLDLEKAPVPALNRCTLCERDNAKTDDLCAEALRHAVQFAEADTIVIAAPFWDLSFPALLKDYLENICVTGITFTYGDRGPVGLCRGKKLYYVTTCGGGFVPDFGYGYVEALAKNFFGIPETCCFAAQGLDVEGADVEEILRQAMVEIDRAFGK